MKLGNSSRHLTADFFNTLGYEWTFSREILTPNLSPKRVRVFSIDNRISMTVLPEYFDLENAGYKRGGMDLVFTDGKTGELDIGEFSSHG